MSLSIEYRPLRSLTRYARNARQHPPAQIAKLRASLTEFGWANPMLIAEGQILAGHGRLAAALELAERGIAIPRNPDPWMAPTIDLSPLTPVQRRAYILQDNRTALDGSFDKRMLKGELTALADFDYDLSLTGFDDDELTDLLAIPGPVDQGAEPNIPMATLRVTCRATHADQLIKLIEKVVVAGGIPDVEIDTD